MKWGKETEGPRQQPKRLFTLDIFVAPIYTIHIFLVIHMIYKKRKNQKHQQRKQWCCADLMMNKNTNIAQQIVVLGWEWGIDFEPLNAPLMGNRSRAQLGGKSK
jgi:hypothetical protein